MIVPLHAALPLSEVVVTLERERQARISAHIKRNGRAMAGRIQEIQRAMDAGAITAAEARVILEPGPF